MRTKPLTSRDVKTIQTILYEQTGCRIKPYLIIQAFTRSSYARKYGGGDNENFEFIGDTVLGYHAVKQLYEHYGTIHADEDQAIYTFRAHEKDFTTLKSRIVSNHTIAMIIGKWDVAQYLLVSQSDIDNDISKQEKIQADLFEAIVGAIAVQCNWNQELMEKVIKKVLPIDDLIAEYEKEQFRLPEYSADNAVTTLKELSEAGRCSIPVYDITGPDTIGYDKNGNPRWICNCRLQDNGITKSVQAHSKKDAKRYCAYLVLCDLFELPNEYGPSKSSPVWCFDGNKLMPQVDFE